MRELFAEFEVFFYRNVQDQREMFKDIQIILYQKV